MKFNYVALDIETQGLDPEIKDAALIPHLAAITVIGIWSPEHQAVFRGPDKISDLNNYLEKYNLYIIGHNLKFDLKHIIYRSPKLKETLIDRWIGDSLLLAHVITKKVDDSYLENYTRLRKEQTKKHRAAGKNSLKVLAPYFLKVDPFWEDPDNHDSDEYVLKDCEYTYRLFNHLTINEATEEELDFCQNKQLPWTKNLLKMESQGIALNINLLNELQKTYEDKFVLVSKSLHDEWAAPISDYIKLQVNTTREHYEDMASKAVNKLKDKSKENIEKTIQRYLDLCNKAISGSDFNLNFSSPKQLQWLLKDYLKYDIKNLSGDESTDKEVLQMLSKTGKKDVELFLEYRKLVKILNSYFPSYKTLMHASGRLHCSFNPTGTRTGRLSSSSPNLQQVPNDLQQLFKADKGCKLITRDMSAIEPALMAYFSEDATLNDIVNNNRNFHSVNAKSIFNLDCSESDVASLYPEHRKAAKEFGLAVLYGAGANRVHQCLTKRGFNFSVSDCRVFVDRLRETYKGVWTFKKKLDKMLEQGETIYNLLGRPIRFDCVNEVYMKGFNTLIQGSASDLLQEATDRIIRSLPDAAPLLIVHDELVVQVPEVKAKLYEQNIMHIMTDFNLINKYGSVKLKTEGNISNAWQK